MDNVILCVNSEYTHSKLEALTALIDQVEHVHIFGEQCERWEQMIECCLHVTAISYPELPISNIQTGDQVICI